MKKEKFSFLILFVEVAAIVFLHSAKNRQNEDNKLLTAKKAMVSSAYQLKALNLSTKVK